MSNTIKWFGPPPPECNVCWKPITTTFIDGKVKLVGPWATMCPSCHEKLGYGLGPGKGQLYELQDNGDWIKKEG